MVINEWLSTNVDSGEGNNKITLTSTANETGEDRTTSLIVRGRNKSATVNVRQLKQSGSESFVFYGKNYSNIPVSGTNADRVLSVFSCNKPCTLIRYDIYKGQDLGMDFVTEETLEMVEGINSIYLNAESNIVDGVTNPWRFVAYALVYEGKSYGYIPIYQQGSTPTITVTPNEVEFHKYGGTATIEITANTNWRIGGDNYKPQITFSNTFGKSGTHTISVTAQEYEGVEDLIYNLWVGLASNISVPLVIKQDSLDMPHNCFYIEPANEGEEITIGIVGRGSDTAYWYHIQDANFEYYDTNTWKTHIIGEYEDYTNPNNLITTNKRIYIKNFDTKATSSTNPACALFYIEGYCNVGGNIETLLGEMKINYAFRLFSSVYLMGDDFFTNKKQIIDASKLILPFEQIERGAYAYMFSGCADLETPPVIKAKYMSDEYVDVDTRGGMSAMFSGCVSLKHSPILYSDYVGYMGYCAMFMECTNLQTITILATSFNPLQSTTFPYYQDKYNYWLGDNIGSNVNEDTPKIFYKNPNATLPEGVVPEGWEVRDYENEI